jgi:IMP dehydrogenase
MSVSTNNFKRYLTFDDVGLIPKYNPIASRMDTNISTTIHNKTYSFPFVPANMDTVISKQMVHKLTQQNGMVIYHRFCSIDEKISMCKEYPNMYMSVGISDSERETIDILIQNGIMNYCIDVAHGHSKQVGDVIKHIWENCPKASIIAGNVCTQEGYRFLVESGANIVKVGVGGGSACTTRMKTGFGVPQFSAIQECYQAKLQLEKEGKPNWLIADGGIKHPRDCAIAFAIGADMIMMGNIFAKTYESNGKKYIKNGDSYQEIPHNEIEAYTHISNGKIYSHYRGQASHNFMKSYYGDKKTRVAEGVDFYTECIGPLEAVLDEYNGSLRSSLTYAGASNLEKYKDNVEVFESTSSYMTESNHRSHQ